MYILLHSVANLRNQSPGLFGISDHVLHCKILALLRSG